MSIKSHHKHEAEEQIKLFQWAEYNLGRYPELELLYHIPNGGSRNKIEALNLKRQGVKSGVPDLCLPVARGTYHGLYIEMKFGKNTPTDNQVKWLKTLKNQGYATALAYSCDEAIDVLTNYLSLKRGNRIENR